MFSHLIAVACLIAVLQPFSAKAGVLTIQNLTPDATSVYALADSGGSLILGNTADNLQVGYFTLNDAGILDAWNAGDLISINSSFVRFGDAFGMEDFGLGYDGIFSAAPAGFSDPFAGKNIYLFASTGSDFTDLSAQYLIYKFDATFTADPFAGELALGTNTYPGVLLVGGFGNFSFDIIPGGEELPGFNTVGVIPEPFTGALLALGLGGLCWLRRRQQTKSA